ncbi:MAG: GNAT family N-acetyltransferase [Bacteroidales bacterium]|nr:GNAT family N-acetyltransferase [Bacteroidales bacterium]
MNQNKLVIREITIKDACNLLHFAKDILREDIYSFTSIEEFNYSEEEEKEWISNILKNKNNILLVVEQDGDLIGNISITQSLTSKSSHVSELSINVDKKYRNKGIGKMMMDIALKKVAECSDIKKIVLQVFCTNERAISLYKKFGFKEEGIFKQHIKFNDESYVDVCFMARWV